MANTSEGDSILKVLIDKYINYSEQCLKEMKKGNGCPTNAASQIYENSEKDMLAKQISKQIIFEYDGIICELFYYESYKVHRHLLRETLELYQKHSSCNLTKIQDNEKVGFEISTSLFDKIFNKLKKLNELYDKYEQTDYEISEISKAKSFLKNLK